jgi:hypothetical protein
MQTILVEDLNQDTKPQPQKWVENTDISIKEIQQQARNTIIPISRNLTFGQPMASGVPYSSDNTVFYSTTSSDWKGFLAMPNIKQLTISNPYLLTLDINIDWNTINFPVGVPSGAISMNTYFVFGEVNPNAPYTGVGNYFIPWFCDNVGVLSYSAGANPNFVAFQKRYILSNTIATRGVTGSGFAFTTTNRTKITANQLNQLYNGKSLMFGVFPDVSSLSVGNQSFVANQVTAFQWQPTVSFTTFGNIANIQN